MRKNNLKNILRGLDHADNLIRVYGGHPSKGRYLPGVQLINSAAEYGRVMAGNRMMRRACLEHEETRDER